MQQILIGNPLQLTGEGLLALHKLKYPETYCYKLTWKNIGIKDKYGEWSYLDTVDDYTARISEEDFLSRESGIGVNYYLLPLNIESGKADDFQQRLGREYFPDNNNTSPHELLWFCTDWLYPKEECRTDKDLINLFHTDIRREYFIYEDLPRVIIIPSDIEWYIDENYLGNEYIQEKARSWS